MLAEANVKIVVVVKSACLTDNTCRFVGEFQLSGNLPQAYLGQLFGKGHAKGFLHNTRDVADRELHFLGELLNMYVVHVSALKEAVDRRAIAVGKRTLLGREEPFGKIPRKPDDLAKH